MKRLAVLFVLAICLVGCKKPAPVQHTVISQPDAPPNDSEITIIGFTEGGANCLPCRRMKPEWKKVGATVYNVHRYQVLAQKYNITVLPTTIWLQDGQVIKRVDGYVELEAPE